jgi:hypothetical protein
MRYNPKARLDTSQMEVRRGGGGGGMRMPTGGGGMKVGGGIGGLVILIIVLLLQSQLGGGGGSAAGPGGQETSSVLAECQDGTDAQQDRQCGMLADVNSIQAFWARALPEQSGRDYRRATTVVFTGGTSTGCGSASADVGPFYCPVDEGVYLDRTFFEDMLQGRLGAKGGLFSEAYVLAHEYGHHVQNILGTMGRVRTQQGPSSDAVRLELQADCYAGMWAKHATEVPDADGQPYILDLTQQDIEIGLDAARAVGDDRIQQRSSGRVDPDAWTHGSSEQRMRWFSTGLEKGTLQACDTFSAPTL